MIGDVATESERRLAMANPRSVSDIRAAGQPMIAFSDPMAVNDRDIKAMLTGTVYRHERIMTVMTAAERVVRRLFQHFLGKPAAMPGHWQADEVDDRPMKARRIADFIAGMTDRYAIIEYQRLFGQADGPQRRPTRPG